jgi:hypothetical protein
MCYSWHEDVEKSVRNDVAREDRPRTVPERPQKNWVRAEHSGFWTFLVGRRDRPTEETTAVRTAEEATTDRIFEKV